MTTLMVNGTDYEVIGRARFSCQGTVRRSLPGSPGHYVEQSVIPFIEATVRLPQGRSASGLYITGAAVRLTMPDGSVVEGRDMFAEGDMYVRGDQVHVRFVGNDVREAEEY